MKTHAATRKHARCTLTVIFLENITDPVADESKKHEAFVKCYPGNIYYYYYYCYKTPRQRTQTCTPITDMEYMNICVQYTYYMHYIITTIM